MISLKKNVDIECMCWLAPTAGRNQISNAGRFGYMVQYFINNWKGFWEPNPKAMLIL